jgi:ATP-dependent DNA helicase Rep
VLGILKDAGGCSDNALARRWQWTISLWKNQGLNSDQAELRGETTTNVSPRA